MTQPPDIDPDRFRLAPLDGARGFAVLAVMADHFQSVLPSAGVLTQVKWLLRCGWSGVDIFFALSGFLITGILLRTRDAQNYFSAFYARRVLRIFPIYYLALATIFLLEAHVAGLSALTPEHALRPAYLLFVQNWTVFAAPSWPPNILGHFWSLATEEQFYLVWPACVLLLGLPALRSAVIAGAAAMVLVRLFYYANFTQAAAFEFANLTRFDGLLLGSLAAVFYTTWNDRKNLKLDRIAVALLLTLVLTTLIFPETSSPFTVLKYTLVSLFASVFVLLLATTDGKPTILQWVMRQPSLRTVGRYSYGMYVYHVPLHLLAGLLIYRYLPVTLRASVPFGISYFLALVLATFFLARFSYEYFERPVLELKRYFRPKFSRDPTAAAAALDGPAP